MPKSKTLASWIEMSQHFIHNQPPRQRDWEPCLFVNRVELREKVNGQKYLIRSTGCEFLKADSKQEMEEKVYAFMLREDVRLLVKDLEANDFDRLPQREDNPSQDIIDGTADIYHFAEEPAAQ